MKKGYKDWALRMVEQPQEDPAHLEKWVRRLEATTNLRLAFFNWVRKENLAEQLGIPERVMKADPATVDGRRTMLECLGRLNFDNVDIFDTALRVYVSQLVDAASKLGSKTKTHIAWGASVQYHDAALTLPIRPAIGVVFTEEPVSDDPDDLRSHIRDLTLVVVPENKATNVTDLKDENLRATFISTLLMRFLHKDFGDYGFEPHHMHCRKINRNPVDDVPIAEGVTMGGEDLRIGLGMFWEVVFPVESMRAGLKDIFVGNREVHFVHKYTEPKAPPWEKRVERSDTNPPRSGPG